MAEQARPTPPAPEPAPAPAPPEPAPEPAPQPAPTPEEETEEVTGDVEVLADGLGGQPMYTRGQIVDASVFPDAGKLLKLGAIRKVEAEA